MEIRHENILFVMISAVPLERDFLFRQLRLRGSVTHTRGHARPLTNSYYGGLKTLENNDSTEASNGNGMSVRPITVLP